MDSLELLLKRIYLNPLYTIGKLYINGKYFCDTLEDTVRDYNKDGDLEDAGETKIFGETAIPYGIYTITMAMSPHFKRILPLLNNVKHFIGILMHSGNRTKDTLGCILVGENKVKGQVINSKATEDKLTKILMEAWDKKQSIKITIE